jgi:hypothetical protein
VLVVDSIIVYFITVRYTCHHLAVGTTPMQKHASVTVVLVYLAIMGGLTKYCSVDSDFGEGR